MPTESQKVLIPAEQIRDRVASLGARITQDYAGKEILCVGVLRGACLFLSDLVREIKRPVELEFIRCSSYHDKTTSSGKVEIEFAQKPAQFEGRHVLLIEDILDTGNTMVKVIEQLRQKKPASLKICVFLDKPSRRESPIQADYRGFEIPNEFVVGYGMDYQERYRNLPEVRILQP